MKGQVQIVSIIMISGVVISLVGAALLWGIPLINKQTSATTFTTATQFVMDLNEEIIDTANTGAGGGSMNIPFGGMTIVPYDGSADSNEILYEISIAQPLALNNSVIYLGGATFRDVVNLTGTLGESLPSIITFRLDPLGTGYVGTYSIKYRELADPPASYQIVLNQGSTEQPKGGSKITWTFDKTFDSPEGVTLTNIIIEGV